MLSRIVSYFLVFGEQISSPSRNFLRKAGDDYFAKQRTDGATSHVLQRGQPVYLLSWLDFSL